MALWSSTDAKTADEKVHYFTQNYPTESDRILLAAHHSTSWFGFSIVAIHVTAYVLRLV